MVVYWRHPLRFAVAKRRHGFQLRSRWISPHPASINDRDDSLCNMSIETCFTNWAKNQTPEELNDDIARDTMRVRVDAKWHKRSSQEGTRMSVVAAEDLEKFVEEAEEGEIGAEIGDDICAVSEDDEQGAYRSL